MVISFSITLLEKVLGSNDKPPNNSPILSFWSGGAAADMDYKKQIWE